MDMTKNDNSLLGFSHISGATGPLEIGAAHAHTLKPNLLCAHYMQYLSSIL